MFDPVLVASCVGLLLVVFLGLYYLHLPSIRDALLVRAEMEQEGPAGEPPQLPPDPLGLVPDWVVFFALMVLPLLGASPVNLFLALWIGSRATGRRPQARHPSRWWYAAECLLVTTGLGVTALVPGGAGGHRMWAALVVVLVVAYYMRLAAEFRGGGRDSLRDQPTSRQ